MYTLNNLLNFSNKTNSLTEFLVLELIKQFSPVIKLSQILSFKGINVQERQLRNIITDLENLNLLVKYRLKNGLLFIFPFIKNKTGNIMPIKRFKRPHKKTINFRPATFFSNGYLYNNIYNIKRSYNVLTIKDINTLHYDEEVITYNNYNKIYNNSHDFVVNKNNYTYIKVLKEKFKNDFPTKNAYINCSLPKKFNYETLKQKILESDFLKNKDNLGFSWFLKHYDAIINDFYKNNKNHFFSQNNSSDFSQRSYTKEFLDSLFDN